LKKLFNTYINHRLFKINDNILQIGSEYAGQQGNTDLGSSIVNIYGKRKDLKRNNDRILIALSSTLKVSAEKAT
jgi:hypothetical protein